MAREALSTLGCLGHLLKPAGKRSNSVARNQQEAFYSKAIMRCVQEDGEAIWSNFLG